MSRAIALNDALLFSEVGRIKKMRAYRLDRGSHSIRSGADRDAVTDLLGPPGRRFDRDGRSISQYRFGAHRVEAVFSGATLERFDITIEAPPLPRSTPPYGRGSRGDLRSPLTLALDGIELGMSASNVNALLGLAEEISPSLHRYRGRTFVGFNAHDEVMWVLGTTLTRDGEPWTEAGLSAVEVQTALAEAGQLHQYNGSAVSYSFRQYGEVRMRLEPDGTVSALELATP
jgi:hypothetical protein